MLCVRCVSYGHCRPCLIALGEFGEVSEVIDAVRVLERTPTGVRTQSLRDGVIRLYPHEMLRLTGDRPAATSDLWEQFERPSPWKTTK